MPTTFCKCLLAWSGIGLVIIRVPCSEHRKCRVRRSRSGTGGTSLSGQNFRPFGLVFVQIAERTLRLLNLLAPRERKIQFQSRRPQVPESRNERETVELGLRTIVRLRKQEGTEVLQGFVSDRDFNQARKLLASGPLVPLVGEDIAFQDAETFRKLRPLGMTIRKTIDTSVATTCIEKELSLLYSDRDFDPFVEHLGLRSAN